MFDEHQLWGNLRHLSKRDGSTNKFKAHLVKKAIPKQKIYIIRKLFSNYKILLYLSNVNNCNSFGSRLFKMDANSAFLNGKLGERIYRNDLLSLKPKEMIIKYAVWNFPYMVLNNCQDVELEVSSVIIRWL